MKNAKLLLILGIATAATLLVSCSTLGTNSQNAGLIACPDCRVVVEVDDSIEDYSNTPTPITRHDCPGCQGRIATLFKEGKFEHRCSICKDSPYSCDVTHAAARSSEWSDESVKTNSRGHTHVFKQT